MSAEGSGTKSPPAATQAEETKSPPAATQVDGNDKIIPPPPAATQVDGNDKIIPPPPAATQDGKDKIIPPPPAAKQAKGRDKIIPPPPAAKQAERRDKNILTPPAQEPPPPVIEAPPPAGPVPWDTLVHNDYNLDEAPSWPKILLSGFQHYVVMLGATVMIASLLVPLMGGDNKDKARMIQTLLFMSGINTLLQSFFGTRLPTVMNASFVFVIPIMSIIKDTGHRVFSEDHERFVYNMRSIQGAMILASCLNMIIGYTKLWGYYARVFSPVSIAPVVCLVGLGLNERGFPYLGKCVEIGLPMLILLFICKHCEHFSKKLKEEPRSWLERFYVLPCIIIIWSFAAIITATGAYDKAPQKTQLHCRTDRSYLMSEAPWISVPAYPFQFGTPIFKTGHVFSMLGAALVVSAESTGSYFAAARFTGATLPPPFALTRSVGLQGIGMFLEGLFGALVASTPSAENVGVIGLTKIGDRRTVQISAAYMIFFSIFGKFGAFFASIPLPIFAAIFCILLGLVAAVGISFTQFTNTNSPRNLYVIGISLFLGISIPQYFNEYRTSAGHGPGGTGWVQEVVNSIFISGPTVALIAATLLDNILDAAETAMDRGMQWWSPFLDTKSDPRTVENYQFPFQNCKFNASRVRT